MRTVGDVVYRDDEVGPGRYTLVWLALMILLALTWAASKLPLGDFSVVVALAIAVAKSALVIWYFMHLRSTNKLVLLLFGMGLAMLALAGILTLSDYLTRLDLAGG